jgi:hypothetical protein
MQHDVAGFNTYSQSPFISGDGGHVFSGVDNILNPMFISNGESAMGDRAIITIG